jgi:hypothetical protein
MGKRNAFLAVAITGAMVVALAFMFATTASAYASGWGWHSHDALFVQTDNLTANSIMVYDRAWDGTLTLAGAYATGGKGGMAAGSAADPLASQGSLASAAHAHVLLAVNAGSNTVSLFRVARGDRLLLKQIVASGGQFPVSIAVRGHLVYVLNAGLDGSVQGYWLAGNHLWPIPDSNRSLGLANTNPPNFLASPGQIGFSPDGSRLIVTTKASGSDIDVFAVGPSGMLSSAPVVTGSATPVPFAFSFDPWGRLVMVEAGGPGISTYIINPDDSLTTIGSAADSTVSAACWISAARGFYFVSNAGTGNISTYVLSASGVPSLVGGPTTAAGGTTDSVATPDQRFLYVECGGAGELLAYRIHGDGSLTLLQTITGLPIPFEGIALN